MCSSDYIKPGAAHASNERGRTGGKNPKSHKFQQTNYYCPNVFAGRAD